MSQLRRKIAFVSQHCILDFTNGAATATRDGLWMLAEQGFECQAFCDRPEPCLLRPAREAWLRRGLTPFAETSFR